MLSLNQWYWLTFGTVMLILAIAAVIQDRKERK